MMPFFRKIIPQIFMAVAFEDKKNVLKICTYRDKTLIGSLEKIFDQDKQLMAYVKNYDKKFYPYRIALFLNSQEQGIIPNLSQDYEAFGVGKISIKTLILNNAQLYTATEHVEYYDCQWEEFGGLDFLFSPFALLYYLIQKEQKDKTTLFVYKYSQSLCLMVCKAGEILIGGFKFFEKNVNLELEDFEDPLGNLQDESSEEHEEEKQNSADEELSLDDFQENSSQENSSDGGDPLETNAEMDSGVDAGMEDEKNDDATGKDEKIELEELGQFGSDMELCRHIISSIEKFYKDEHYGGDFIDELIFFTHEDIVPSALDFLENETFLSPQIKKINHFDLIIELMRKELNFDL